jgi:hypothetical protein
MHDRLPRFFCWLPRIILVFDLFLLLYFFSGITDVNWGAPLSEPLAFAVGLAAMITAASYGCLAFAGHRLRSRKNHSGDIAFEDLDWLTGLVTFTAALGIILLALLMFVRMRSEVLLALGPGSDVTAIVVAGGLAGVSILANILVVCVHALNGSEETDRLEALGSAVSAALAREDRMRRRAERLDHVIAMRERAAHRLAAGGVSKAERPMDIAGRIIDTARIPSQRAALPHEIAADASLQQGFSGHRVPEGVPQVDERPLRLVLEHVDTDLPSEVNRGRYRVAAEQAPAE